MTFEAICPENRERINRFIEEHWFTTTMVVRGREIDMTRVDGVAAMDGGEIVGLATFLFHDGLCEIVSLDSLRENQGIGTALLTQALAQARQRGCAKAVLITANDNLRAMGFYQKRGFDMVALYRNALDVSRRLKPEIPAIGENGIPLRHEIEFEKEL